MITQNNIPRNEQYGRAAAPAMRSRRGGGLGRHGVPAGRSRDPQLHHLRGPAGLAVPASPSTVITGSRSTSWAAAASTAAARTQPATPAPEPPSNPSCCSRKELPRAGGLVQFRGGEISEIWSGDVITTSSGKWHWHGAGPEMDWASRSPTTSTTAGGRHERVHRHLRADPASRDSAVSRVIHGHERVRAPGRARIRNRDLPTLGSRPTSGTGLPQRRSDGDGRSPQWCGGIIRVGMAVGVEAGSGVVCGEPGQEGDAARREPGEGVSLR